jgi:hypothetical protein
MINRFTESTFLPVALPVFYTYCVSGLMKGGERAGFQVSILSYIYASDGTGTVIVITGKKVHVWQQVVDIGDPDDRYFDGCHR